MFRDKEGNISSKRILGTVVIAFSLFLTSYLIFSGLVDKLSQLAPLYTLGGGLVGLGVAERRK